MTNMKSHLSDDTPSIIQFENANEGRSYPFSDNASMFTIDGRAMPDSIITDLHIVVPHDTKPYLSSVYISKHMISACIRIIDEKKEKSIPGQNNSFDLIHKIIQSDSINTTKSEYGSILEQLKAINFKARGTDALSIVVSAKEFEPYRPYRLEKTSGAEDIGGVITFGNVIFPEQPETYRFADCSIPVTEGAVSHYEPARLRKIIDPRTGKSVSGNVKIEFSSHVKAAREGDGIRLILDEASKTGLLSDCDKKRSSNVCGSMPIRSINGIAPDSKKRIVIWFH